MSGRTHVSLINFLEGNKFSQIFSFISKTVKPIRAKGWRTSPAASPQQQTRIHTPPCQWMLPRGTILNWSTNQTFFPRGRSSLWVLDIFEIASNDIISLTPWGDWLISIIVLGITESVSGRITEIGFFLQRRHQCLGEIADDVLDKH